MNKQSAYLKKYLSTTEVAKLLEVSRVTVFNRIKAGEIKAEKIGRNYAIPSENFLINISNDSSLSKEEEKEIEIVVKKAVKEYGEAFKLLGRE